MAFIPDQLVTAVIPSVSIILFSRVTMLTNGLSVVSIFKPISLTARTVESLWLNFIGEAGYNLHLYSNYSQFFHLYGGISALAGYETVNRERRCCLTEQRSTTRTLSSMVELLTFRPTSTSRIE